MTDGAPTALIVGSGPAGAAAALALTRRGVKVTVVDIGVTLDAAQRVVVDRLAALPPALWTTDEVAAVSAQPTNTRVRGLPEKRSYRSDFPFRDVGQLDGISASGAVNRSLVSGAYGGFSNVWGSQVMPFTNATFDSSWPVTAKEMADHYEAILSHIPFTAVEDDLAARFPLLVDASPPPELSPRSQRVLAAYARHRSALNRHGVTLGTARLAMRAPACTRCGLCMTGCPTHLIYSASQTFDELRASGAVSYEGGVVAVGVREDEHGATVTVRNVDGGGQRELSADRVYLACGAVGTTRLVASSMGLYDVPLSLQESVQFTLPFFSLRPTSDPTNEDAFTLNQFNMVVELDDDGFDVSQLHFYSYNDAFFDALPGLLGSGLGRPVGTYLMRHLSVALGYLPSWASPQLRVRVSPPSGGGDLARLDVTRDEPHWRSNQMLRGVLRRVASSARHLDLWPLLPAMSLSAGGKSYHWGSSFPMASEAGPTTSDRLGRVGSWRRIHLVDASVFPNVPATTFTLTIMANAHRIATESMEGAP